MKIDDKECLNFATFNFLGFVGNDKIEVHVRSVHLSSLKGTVFIDNLRDIENEL